jgi:hypothetical protein
VARILHITVGREHLLERMSLLVLQTTGNGGCGGSTAATTVPVVATAQLTTGAPWVTASSAVPITTGSASTGSPSSGTPSQPHVRSGGGRSVTPRVMITPSATRTAEQAATGQHPMSWTAIVLVAVLALAVSLALVRRRLVPALAGRHPADGNGDGDRLSNGMAIVTAPTSRSDSPAPEPAPDSDTGSAASATATDRSSGVVAEPPSAPPRLPPPSAPPQLPATRPRAVVESQPEARPSWAREHATRGALVATVLAGGLMRILNRARRR